METSDDDIARHLREAQAAVDAAREATRLRQAAVTEARAAGWSKYRIAKELGVEAPTVDSIIKAAARADTRE